MVYGGRVLGSMSYQTYSSEVMFKWYEAIKRQILQYLQCKLFDDAVTPVRGGGVCAIFKVYATMTNSGLYAAGSALSEYTFPSLVYTGN